MTKSSEGVDHEKSRLESGAKNNEDLFCRIEGLNKIWRESMKSSRKLSEQMQAMLDEIKTHPRIVITQPTLIS